MRNELGFKLTFPYIKNGGKRKIDSRTLAGLSKTAEIIDKISRGGGKDTEEAIKYIESLTGAIRPTMFFEQSRERKSGFSVVS